MWTNFLKGTFWMVLVSLFGLSQLLISLCVSAFQEESSITWYLIAKDGVLLFFALAVTITITMDYWFDPIASESTSLAKATAFVFYPIILMAVVITIYCIILFGNPENNKELINTVSLCVLGLAGLFGVVGKTYLFICSNMRRMKEG